MDQTGQKAQAVAQVQNRVNDQQPRRVLAAQLRAAATAAARRPGRRPAADATPLIPVAPMGWLYAVVALVAGGLFVAEAHRLWSAAKAGAPQSVLKPMRLFHYSISYVTIVFLAVAIDPILFLPLS